MLDSPLRIAVAGGSIGGLSAGVALNGAGFDVQVYEQNPGPMATRGAGIVVQGELMQLLRQHGSRVLPTTSCRMRRYLQPGGGAGESQRAPQAFTSWEAIYNVLRATLPAERYHMGSTLSDVQSHAEGVSALINGETRIDAHLLVCADGSQSASRRRLLPEIEAGYAGYVAWRGTLDEAEAPTELIEFFDDSFTFCEARSKGHILAYFIPGNGAETAVGKRRLNWVWYVAADAIQRDRLLVDAAGRQHHASLQEGQAPEVAVAELNERARGELHPMFAKLVKATSRPFLQTIVDVLVPQLVFGRTCLLGDAAFVVRPHTAGATAKAAKDALSLASALSSAKRNIDAGLASYQQTQLEYGRSMAGYGVALGKRWAS